MTGTETNEPILQCEHVTLAYENQTVLSDVSFSVEAGDYLCILGENGTGKSTLMKGILGLKRPVQGEIRFGGGLVQSQIGYVPQQSPSQRDFPASVWEVVLSGCLNGRGLRPGYGKREKELAMEKLELLNIAALRKKSFSELSGGQRQRVLLARALCAAQKLILLDEPTAGLDPVAEKELYELLDVLNKKHGIAVIMISHEIREALERADHILYLAQEEHVFGTTDTFLQSAPGRRFLRRFEA